MTEPMEPSYVPMETDLFGTDTAIPARELCGTSAEHPGASRRTFGECGRSRTHYHQPAPDLVGPPRAEHRFHVVDIDVARDGEPPT